MIQTKRKTGELYVSCTKRSLLEIKFCNLAVFLTGIKRKKIVKLRISAIILNERYREGNNFNVGVFQFSLIRFETRKKYFREWNGL